MTRWFTQVLGYVNLINANIQTGAQEGEISALWLSPEGGGGMELRCACVCVRVRGGVGSVHAHGSRNSQETGLSKGGGLKNQQTWGG